MANSEPRLHVKSGNAGDRAAGPPQIEAVSQTNTFAQPILPLRELAEHGVHRLVGRRTQHPWSRTCAAAAAARSSGGRAARTASRRMDRTGEPARSGIGDGPVDRRHERPRRGVQVVEALGHRPALRPGRPLELGVRQVRHESRHLLANRQQLVLISFKRRVHCCLDATPAPLRPFRPLPSRPVTFVVQ